VLSYDYKRPVDVPERIEPALVYHIVGSRQTYPNFAVWEEDYLEFICGLTRHHAQLERLFLLLKTRYLLLLGAPFDDWIVRFFLFLVKGGRFTDRRKDDIQACLADRPENLGEPLIFFFNQVVGTTRIIPGDPADFVRELTERWNTEYASIETGEDVLVQMPDEMPRGTVFISYSRDDREAVVSLVRGLRAAQIPIWVDKQRLHAGENYQRNLEFAVKSACSFFVSVISRATESDPTRFVHTERRWAAQRHVDGFVYYIPVIIDDTKELRWSRPILRRSISIVYLMGRSRLPSQISSESGWKITGWRDNPGIEKWLKYSRSGTRWNAVDEEGKIP
jgi:hypothetical protein